MFDHRAISANEYRSLLRQKEWTHVVAGKVLGSTDRTSKAWARKGVSSGPAAMAVRMVIESGQSEPTRLLRLETYCGKLETASYELLARAERAEHRAMTAETALRQVYTAFAQRRSALP